MRNDLQIYAKEVEGISTQGSDMRIDLEGVDVGNLVAEIEFEIGTDEVLSVLDYDKVAAYVAEMERE